MIPLLRRFLVTLLFSLIVAALTLILASSRAQAQTMLLQTQTPPCRACHIQVHEAWLTGWHGRSGSDPTFKNAWEARGKPGACLVCHVTGYDPATATWKEDGVACEACHSPMPLEHSLNPKAYPVPVDRSSDLCGHCHTDPRFGWDQWKVSAHYQRHMTCTTCHDPHTASVKTLTDENGNPLSSSALCLNCHREYSMTIALAPHTKAGVQCVDCHLRHYGQQTTRDIHTIPDHSFQASITLCSSCHADQMHGDGKASNATADKVPLEVPVMPSMAALPVSSTPAPANFSGLAVLTGLLGLAGGMVLAPWLERWYRHLNRAEEKHENETPSS